MRAVFCRTLDGPEGLVLAEAADPSPGPGQVLLAVGGCGVNFPDLLMTEGKYQRKPNLPFSPGGEVAGTICALGPGVEDYRLGDRVIAYTGFGGFAEKVAVDAHRVTRAPANYDLVQASAFLFAYGTVLHALTDRGRLAAGETLLVLGAAGGIGIAAVQLGKLLGAKVIAAASSDEKLEFCRAHGADHSVNYRTEDLRDRLREFTGGRGVDVVLDAVGGPFSEPALRAIAWNGRFLVVGFASGEIARPPLNLPLLKGCAIVGVAWGEFLLRGGAAVTAHLAELTRLAESGKLAPAVTRTYPLDRAAQALVDMRERRITGKVVVVP